METRTTFYDHPDLYDLEYAGLSEDIDHYRRFARGGARLLELGCGTGRLTLPLARTKIPVTGLDASGPMLDRLRARLRAEPGLDLTLVQGDFRSFVLDHNFDRVILPFNAIHHARGGEDVRALLASVSRHLTPDGVLALDMLIPDPRFWDRDPEGMHEVRWYPDPAGGRMKTWENGWYDPITQVNHIRYHYQRSSGHQEVVHVGMRMFYPQEMLDLLRTAGWLVRRLDGDFRGRPLDAGCGKMVLELVPERAAG